MADTLQDLYTKSPGTQQVATTPNAQASNATAGTATAGTATASNANASTYNAQTQDVPTENLSSSRLNAITSQDSPLMQRARQEGMLLAARRGLQNSSIAAGAAQGAVVDRATPLATQEADLLQGQRLANQNASNTASQFNAGAQTDVSKFNAANTTDVSKTNAGLATDTSKLNAQLGTDVSKLNAQNATETSRFNSETAAQKAQQDAQAENAMRTAVMNQNAELNKQYLQGSQSIDLATVQAQYQALIQSNASAANLYNTYFQTIAQVMSNTNMDPSRVAQIVGSLQQSLVGGMDFLNAMGGGTAPGGTAPTGAPASTTPTTGATTPTVGVAPPIRIPRTPTSGTQIFNAAGGEAATTGTLSNARNVLANGFAQQQAIANPAPTSTPAPGSADTVAPSTPGPSVGDVAGVLGTAAKLGGKVVGGSLGGTLGAAGSGLSAVGDISSGNYLGLIRDANGALSAIPTAAGSLVGTGAGLSSGVASGAAANAALGEAGFGSGAASGASSAAASGAGASLGTLATGAGYAAAVIAAGQLIHKAFNANGSVDRNRASFAQVTNDWEQVPLARVGAKGMYPVTAYNIPNIGWIAMTQKQYDDLAGKWYGAVFHPDGDQEGWQKKLQDTIAGLKPLTQQGIDELKSKMGGSWNNDSIKKVLGG